MKYDSEKVNSISQEYLENFRAAISSWSVTDKRRKDYGYHSYSHERTTTEKGQYLDNLIKQINAESTYSTYPERVLGIQDFFAGCVLGKKGREGLKAIKRDVKEYADKYASAKELYREVRLRHFLYIWIIRPLLWVLIIFLYPFSKKLRLVLDALKYK